MTRLIFEAILWGASSGIVGATYRGILAEEPTFNFWWRFGARFEGKWFFKPIWGCAHCFAGQFCLWTFLYLRFIPLLLADYGRISAICVYWGFWLFRYLFLLFALIVAISAAIIVAKILTWTLNRLT